MVAYAFHLPKGIPGNLSRPLSPSIIEPQPYASATPFPGYGLPGKFVNGTFVPPTAAADVIYGFLIRPYPTTGLNPSDPLGTAVPPTKGVADIMRKGYMTVKCNAGTPAPGGTVYVRVAAAAAGTPIGGIEAASVTGDTVAIPNAQFMDSMDPNGNVEIYFGGNPS